MYSRPFFFSPLLLLGVLLLTLTWTTPAIAQESDVPEHGTPVVSVGFRPLVLLRATVYGVPPELRAKTAMMRIADIVKRGVTGPVEVVPRTEGMSIVIGGSFAFLITPDDLDKIAGETLDGVTERARAELVRYLDGLASMQNPAFLAKAVGKVLLSLIALILLFLLLLKLEHRLSALLTRLEERLLGHLQIGGFRLLDHLLDLTQLLLRLLLWLPLLIPADLWLAFSLSQFPATRWWGEQLSGMALDLLKKFGISFLSALPDLIMVVLLLALTQVLVRLVKTFFSSVKEERLVLSWVDVEIAAPLEKISILFVWLMALVMIYPYLPGSSSEAFKGLSIMVGVMISLGSGSVFSQIMAGLTLMFSRSFKPGDYVQIGETEGIVLTLGYLSTKIRTGRNEVISLPNTLLLNTATKNFSKEQRTIGIPLTTRVSIGYDAPWRVIHRLLLEAATQTQGIKPDARVFQIELADFYIVYELLTHLDGSVHPREARSELHQNIQDAFNIAGIQIMSPHYEENPDKKVWVPPSRWEGEQTVTPAEEGS